MTPKKEHPFLRTNLFSKDFILNHLNDLPEYTSLDDNLLKSQFKEVKLLYNEGLKDLKESQLENNFLQPIFRLLDHIYEVQTSKKSDEVYEGTKSIDYAFFYNNEDKESFIKNNHERNTIKYSTCSTICETKKWALLDGYDTIKKKDNTCPIWQLKMSYLDNINPKEQKATVPFGILTDGKSWRIYSYRAETDKFLEVNLEHIITSNNYEGFKLFWFFFSKEAFRGISYLSIVESGSKKLQSEVSDELRKQVYISLELIATGIFRVYNNGDRRWKEFEDYIEVKTVLAKNNLDAIDISIPEIENVILSIIYSESLVYLFRILFLLYANHRNLFTHSKVESIFYNLLAKIEKYNDIGRVTENNKDIADKNDDYDINDIFREINLKYNGGLFDREMHPILDRFDIDNVLYANALDYLTRVYQTNGKSKKPLRVDFSVLEVRHLGTIYEGLLEYKLKRSTEKTTIPLLSDKKKNRMLLKDDLYLVNDKGDRKATGSYYTPDYIVEYIVKNTVGPLVDGIANNPKLSLSEKINSVLSLRICDPAMGSGHFLVEVISFINNRINDLIQSELEVFHGKPGRKSKLQLSYEELLALWEDGHYKRIIGKRCIYGVDKNPMAVELAKLSIWIFTLQKDKKLEFFDYNLRCGDSLIGSQDTIFSTDHYKNVDVLIHNTNTERMLFASDEELYRNVVSDFKEEFRKYFEFERVEDRIQYYEKVIRPGMEKLKYLANIELSIQFAEKGSSLVDIYKSRKNELLKIIRDDGKNEYLKRLAKGNNISSWEKELYQNAQKITDEYNPIHWELDFPNVFIENGGFDIVMGNPPYFNIQTLGIGSPIAQNIQKTYTEIWMDKSDIFFYFITKGIMISKNKIGLIVSNAFLFSDKGQKLRNYILKHAPISKIVNFEKHLVFPEASITTAIVEFDKNSKNHIGLANVLTEKKYTEKEIKRNIDNIQNYFTVHFKKDSVFALVNDKLKFLNDKIDGQHKQLNSIFKIGKGMETATNHVFIFQKIDNTIPKQFFKKRMSGEIIGKYYISSVLEYLLYFEDVSDFEKLPDPIQKHLIKFKEDLENRATVKNEGRAWWRYSRPMHKELYHLNKIWCSFRSTENRFCYDDTKEFIGLTNTTVIFDTNEDLDLKYLLTLLNSKLLNYRFKSIGKQTGGGVFEYFENSVGKLPIPQISRSRQAPFIQKAEIMLSKNKELQELNSDFWELFKADVSFGEVPKKLEQWYLLDWKEFIIELKKKKINLSVLLEEKWFSRFKRKKEEAASILKIIDQTDKEIDSMVYQLYELTEEEIRIIENRVE